MFTARRFHGGSWQLVAVGLAIVLASAVGCARLALADGKVPDQAVCAA